MRRWLGALVAVAAMGALLLAGCGDDAASGGATTGPTISDVEFTANETTVTITATVKEVGKLFWVAYVDGTEAPADAAALIADAGKAIIAPIVANSGSDGQVVAAAGMVTVSITGLAIGTSYDLYAVAQDAAGNNSALSAKFDLSTLPPAVTELSAVAAGGDSTNIALSWTLPAAIPNDAAKLQLRYATTRAGLAEATPVDIATTRATILTATSYTLTAPLTSGTEYHFAVLIVNSAGNALPLSGPGFTDSVSYVTTGIPGSTRPIVSAVQISTVDATTATVTAVVNETGKLFWVLYVDGTAAPANTAALIADAGRVTTTIPSIVANSGSEGITVAAAGMVSISITGLVIGTSYDLYVAATDTDSNNSALPVKLDLSTVPPAVTGLSAVAAGDGSSNIVLSWTLPATIPNDAAQLQLRYATTRAGLASATPVDIATTRADILTATSYTLTAPLTSGTEYHFAVLIVNSAGNALPLSGAGFTDSVSYVTTGTPDSVLPTVSSAQISTVGTTTATVTATVSEAGKLFWVAYADGTDAPADAAALIADAGKDKIAPIVANSGSEGQVVAAAGMVTVPITGLVIGTSYDLYAVAKDAAGNNSVLSAKLALSTLPPAVTDLTAVAVGGGTTNIALSWTPPAAIPNDAAKLQLRYATTRAELAGATPVDIATTRADILTANTYTLTEPLTSGTLYHFAILIINSAGNSLPLSGPGFADSATYVTTGTPAFTLPGIPTDLRVTALSASSGSVSVTVQWQNPINAANIELSWTPNPNTETIPVTAAAGSTQSTTITLTDNTTYIISAVAININSVRSSAARITDQRVDLAAPAVPTIMSLVPAPDGSIIVSWTSSTSTDVAGYEVLWATTGAMLSTTPIGLQVGRQEVAATETSATTGVLTPGTTYYFVVIASDGANTRGAIRTSSSAVASRTTAPVAPTVTVTSGTELIISWVAVGDTTQYRIFRSATSDGAYTRLSPTTAIATPYTDSGLTIGTAYYYKLAACSGSADASCSEQSAVASGITTPSAPATAPTVTATSSTVLTISWSPVDGATQYRIFRSTDFRGTYTRIATTIDTTSYADSSPTTGTTYYYRLAACSGAADESCSARSAVASGITNPPTPATPIVTVTSSTVLTISWSMTTGALRYRIFRSTISNGMYTQVAFIRSSDPTSHTDSGLTAGTTYYYRLAACSGAAEASCSEQSETASGITIPSTPTISTVAATSATALNISWTAVGGATQYRIFRSATSGGTYERLSSDTEIATTEYTDSGLTPVTTYYYKLAACNADANCSVQSAVASGITDLSIPAAPTVTVTSNTVLTISWIAVGDTTQYRIFRSATSDGAYTRLSPNTAIATPYTDSGLTIGTAYYYKLAACSGSADASCSGQSVTASGTTADPPQSVSLANRYTCAIRSSGSLYCWGVNEQGNLGDGSTAAQNSPVAVDLNGATAGNGTAKQVATGSAHACAISSDGSLFCWGWNAFGQLGIGSNSRQTRPAAVDLNGATAGNGMAKQVAAGYSHTCAIDSDGSLYCWGGGGNDQLGTGSTSNQTSPVAVDLNGATAGNGMAKQISTGHSHTCAIGSDDSLYCWGYGRDGRLGTGSASNQTSPVVVDLNGATAGGTAKQVSAGSSHTCAIDSDDSLLYCWGKGSNGQLGTKSTSNQTSPVAVDLNGSDTGNGTAKQVAAGSSHTCAIDSDDSLYCWGESDNGRLGTGSTSDQTSPVAVDLNGSATAGSGTAKQVSAGNAHTCTIDSDDSLYCWGANHTGQLGDGSRTTRHTPVVITVP